MNNKIRVSIAVPIYNASKYFSRCLKSLFEQSYKNIEYVFVNDGSTDNSMDILYELTAKYPLRKNDVKIIDRKENRGVAVTRNDLLLNCSSDYIFFVDSDDYIDSDIIENLVIQAEETNADIVSSGFVVHQFGREEVKPSPRFNSKDEMLQFLLSQGSFHELFCRLIKRDLFYANNIRFIPELNIGEDWLVMVKCTFYADNIANIEQCGYHYNCDNSYSAMSSIQTHTLQKQLEDLKIFEAIFSFLTQHNYHKLDKFKTYAGRKAVFSKWEAIKCKEKKTFDVISGIEEKMSISCRDLKYDISYVIKWWLMKQFNFAIIVHRICLK